MRNKILVVILLVVYPVMFSTTVASEQDNFISTMNSVVNIIDVPVQKGGNTQWYQGYQINITEKGEDNFAVSIGRFAGEALTVELGVFESRIINLDGEEIKVLMIKRFNKTSQTSTLTARIIFNGLFEASDRPTENNEPGIFLLYAKSDYYCDQFGNSSPLCDQQLLDAVSSYLECLQVTEDQVVERQSPNENKNLFGALFSLSISIDSSAKKPKDGYSLKVGRVKGQNIYLKIREARLGCKDSYQGVVKELPNVLKK